MKKKIVIVVFLLAVASCALVKYCISNDGDDSAAITIGAIVPLTGQFANAGNSVRAGLDFACGAINEQSTNKIRIVYYDTHSEARNAATGYNKLRNLNHVKCFITTLSDHSFAIKPLVIKDDGLLFCIASHTGILIDGKRSVCQLANTSKDEAECLCDVILASTKFKKVYYYGLNTDAGLDFAAKFENRLKDKLVGKAYYSEDYATLKNLAAANRHGSVDCIIVVGYAPAMGYLIRQIREGGFTGSILANVGFNTPAVIEAAGPFSHSVQYVDYAFPYKSRQHQIKDAQSMKSYGSSYNCLSYLAMGGCHLLHLAIECKDDMNAVKGLVFSNAEYNFENTTFFTHSNGSITAALRISNLEK